MDPEVFSSEYCRKKLRKNFWYLKLESNINFVTTPVMLKYALNVPLFKIYVLVEINVPSFSVCKTFMSYTLNKTIYCKQDNASLISHFG